MSSEVEKSASKPRSNNSANGMSAMIAALSKSPIDPATGTRFLPPGLVHGGWLVAKMLKREGVTTVFTLSGGHVAPIYDGCLREGIRVVDMRHEQSAVHAAEGWARVTGQLGVAILTAGPGVTDGVTGIANAFQAPSPVLILAGRSPLNQEGMGGLQEMDQVALVRSITKWAKTAYETKRIPQLMAEAFRHAFAGRVGPVFLDFPLDILGAFLNDSDAPLPPLEGQYRISEGGGASPRLVSEAAALLGQAERPVIMAGGAVWWSQGVAALQHLAENLQSPVYLNGMGRGLLPAQHPLFFSLSRKQALKDADVAFVIGTPLDFRLNFGKVFGSQTRLVWLDSDPREVGLNLSPAVGLAGNVRLVLEQLSAELEKTNQPQPKREEWLKQLREVEQQALAEDEPFMHSDQVPIHPLRMVLELRDYLSEDTIVVADGGDIVTFGARVLRISKPAHWLDPGQLGCLGVGPGFAIASKLAFPDKPVLLLLGDGSFGLNGMEFETMVRHKLPIVGVIGNDGAWGQMLRPQLELFGHDVAASLSPGIRYDKMVEALGGYGELITEPEQIRPALERAFASGKPACLNIITDPQIGYNRSVAVGL